MANQRYSLMEQETIINFNREEKEVSVYTADPTMIRKLDRFCSEQPEYFKCVDVTRYQDGEIAAKFYSIASKKLVSIHKKASTREMTDEERIAAAERLRSFRKSST